ncbi:Hypothetical predicted protein [Podarcis lilfordi]|uniref:Uncharacterized protein n=1 Tax=Podarcis lilfordi TaxID=74358 RepID=A0AA35KD76_9SAUR|nr:Hypothetical predicted protein [Podarcis lilfordi]
MRSFTHWKLLEAPFIGSLDPGVAHGLLLRSLAIFFDFVLVTVLESQPYLEVAKPFGDARSSSAFGMELNRDVSEMAWRTVGQDDNSKLGAITNSSSNFLYQMYEVVRRISLECPVAVVTARKILQKFEEVASKIDGDLLTLSNVGIASNLRKDLGRSDSFPLSVIGDSTNSLGSKERAAPILVFRSCF